LKMVKQQIGSNPQVNSNVPPEQQEAVHQEVATQITKGLANQAEVHGGIGGLLSKLQDAVATGGPVVNAIEGGIIGSLTSKFGLPPAATGAIAAALPGLLQKFANKAADPNDKTITSDSIKNTFQRFGMGNVFSK
jgi:uncharacterized protein YidB (DUF937 family)